MTTLRYVPNDQVPTILEGDLATAPAGVYRLVHPSGEVITTRVSEYYDVVVDELRRDELCDRMARVMPPPAHEPKGVESYTVRPDGLAVIVAWAPSGSGLHDEVR